MDEQGNTEALDLESGTVVRHTLAKPPSAGRVNGGLRRICAHPPRALFPL